MSDSSSRTLWLGREERRYLANLMALTHPDHELGIQISAGRIEGHLKRVLETNERGAPPEAEGGATTIIALDPVAESVLFPAGGLKPDVGGYHSLAHLRLRAWELAQSCHHGPLDVAQIGAFAREIVALARQYPQVGLRAVEAAVGLGGPSDRMLPEPFLFPSGGLKPDVGGYSSLARLRLRAWELAQSGQCEPDEVAQIADYAREIVSLARQYPQLGLPAIEAAAKYGRLAPDVIRMAKSALAFLVSEAAADADAASEDPSEPPVGYVRQTTRDQSGREGWSWVPRPTEGSSDA